LSNLFAALQAMNKKHIFEGVDILGACKNAAVRKTAGTWKVRGRSYDYGARLYDPVTGRWGTVDPLAETFDNVSPYNYGSNNSLIVIDSNGMAASPIYDRYGIFLGADDEGLQGEAIVMDYKE